jgi:integrase
LRLWRLEPPKTRRSRRALPLDEATVAALRVHRDRQAVERLVAGERYAAHGFVFCDQWGEPSREDALYKGPFRRALAAAGLPSVTLYALRHGCATLMMETGKVGLKEVAEQLGDSSITVTGDVYSHVSAGHRRKGTEALGRYVFRRES